MGGRFELRTNHNSLKYLFDQPTLNARQSRWLEFLCEYDFDIKHIKGKENKVAYALSKRVHELHATTISMYQTNIKGRILEVASADLQYMELVAKLQQGKMPQKVEDYKLETDCWHRGRPRVQRSRAHQQIPNYRPFRQHLRSR
jgi:hypothetical protein